MRNSQTEIHFEQAIHIQKEQHKISEERRLELMEEIKTSSFEFYDAQDINYFANELGITPNEVRQININANKDISAFDLIQTFENDDTDSIMSFY